MQKNPLSIKSSPKPVAVSCKQKL